MKEITEYRKASVEALGLEHSKPMDGDDIWLHTIKNDRLCDEKWQPDTDLNQMGMLIRHLAKNGIRVYLFIEGENDVWGRLMEINKETIDIEAVQSIEVAVMKLFMEYIKSK